MTNGDNIGAVQSRNSPGFALEAGVDFGIFGVPGRQELERDFAVEFGVFGEVDFPHAACAELFEDFVVRYGLANHI